jgi:hypothetical protein
MFICLLSTFKLTAHKKVTLKNDPPPPSQPVETRSRSKARIAEVRSQSAKKMDDIW